MVFFPQIYLSICQLNGPSLNILQIFTTIPGEIPEGILGGIFDSSIGAGHRVPIGILKRISGEIPIKILSGILSRVISAEILGKTPGGILREFFRGILGKIPDGIFGEILNRNLEVKPGEIHGGIFGKSLVADFAKILKGILGGIPRVDPFYLSRSFYLSPDWIFPIVSPHIPSKTPSVLSQVFLPKFLE